MENNFLKVLGALSFFSFVFMAAGILLPLALDAIEREQNWRAARICAQGYYCNPKAGP